MIGFLKGTNIHSGKDYIILNTGSIGYKVHVTLTTKAKKQLQLFIYTKVTESDIALFGFQTKQELEIFESLIKVSSIGPKIALSILSTTTVNNITQAIKSANINFFTAIPGLGKKGAQKIILELKNKTDKNDLNLRSENQDSDLYQALLNLGFKSTEINPIITKIDTNTKLQNQIKQALKLLQ